MASGTTIAGAADASACGAGAAGASAAEAASATSCDGVGATRGFAVVRSVRFFVGAGGTGAACGNGGGGISVSVAVSTVPSGASVDSTGQNVQRTWMTSDSASATTNALRT